MEDNYNELNKNWRVLEESWNRVDESKSKKGLSKNDHQSATKGRATQVHKDKKKAFKRWKWKDGKRIEEVDEAACGGMTAAGAGNIAGVAVNPASQGDVRQAGYAEKLGKKKPNMRENFDLNTLGKPQMAKPMGGTPPMGKPMAKPPTGMGLGKPPVGVGPVAEEPDMGMGMEDDMEGGVGDVIAAIQARYPGAVIEITVCAPENHRFSDADLSHATEVANSSEAPEELGGAWEKTGGEEGMEDEEGTKPFREEFAPYGGSKDDAGDDEPEEKEEPEDDEGGDKPAKKEKKDKKPSFGGGDDEGGEGGSEVDSCAGITEDSISMSPEAWSEFLGSVDMAGGEEEGIDGEVEEGERSMEPHERGDVKNGIPPGAKPPRKPMKPDPTDGTGVEGHDEEPDMVDPRA